VPPHLCQPRWLLELPVVPVAALPARLPCLTRTLEHLRVPQQRAQPTVLFSSCLPPTLMPLLQAARLLALLARQRLVLVSLAKRIVPLSLAKRIVPLSLALYRYRPAPHKVGLRRVPPSAPIWSLPASLPPLLQDGISYWTRMLERVTLHATTARLLLMARREASS